MYHIAMNVIAAVMTSTTSLMIVSDVEDPAREQNPARQLKSSLRTRRRARRRGRDAPFSESSSATPRYTVMNCFGSERNAAAMNTQMFIPHVENTAVVTADVVNLSYRRRDGARTMAGDGAVPRNERDLEPALAHDAREAGVLQLLLLELLAAGGAAMFERAVKVEIEIIRVSVRRHQ